MVACWHSRAVKAIFPAWKTNKLVSTGVYGCMHHPMHFGLLFFPTGVALILGSPSLILFIAPLEMLFMMVMIKLVEEPETIRKFGDTYRKYQKQVPIFNLRPACWQQILND